LAILPFCTSGAKALLNLWDVYGTAEAVPLSNTVELCGAAQEKQIPPLRCGMTDKKNTAE